MTIYAIIEAGGEQIQIQTGRFYNFRNLSVNYYLDQLLSSPNWKKARGLLRFVLYRILMIRKTHELILGRPWIDQAAIQGHLLHFYRNQKTVVYKFKSKKKTRKKHGYRQFLFRILIDNLDVIRSV
jgi:large subunit ribosomal protein L21